MSGFKYGKGSRCSRPLPPTSDNLGLISPVDMMDRVLVREDTMVVVVVAMLFMVVAMVVMVCDG